MKEVSYLGHVFSSSGMAPDPKKIQVVQEGPVRQMLPKFASSWASHPTIDAIYTTFLTSQHHLTTSQKRAHPSSGVKECEDAFTTLTHAPVLAYPQFDHQASEFSLQTDASAVGIRCGTLTGWPYDCLCQSVSKCPRMPMQRYTKRMSCYGVCAKVGSTIQTYHRSCPTPVVICTENGGHVMPLGTSNAGI